MKKTYGQDNYWFDPVKNLQNSGKIGDIQRRDVIPQQSGMVNGSGIERVDYTRLSDQTRRTAYIVYAHDATDTYFTWFCWPDNRLTTYRAGCILRATGIYHSILRQIIPRW